MCRLRNIDMRDYQVKSRKNQGNSSKDMASSRNLVSTIAAQASPQKKGGGARKQVPEGEALPRKCDYRTDRHTDRQTHGQTDRRRKSDTYVLYASQATQKEIPTKMYTPF